MCHSKHLSRALVAVLLLLLGAGALHANPAFGRTQTDLPGEAAPEDATLYIVILAEPAVPGYRGGVPGVRAADMAGPEGRFEPESPASRAYHRYLLGRQAAVQKDLAAALGRPVAVKDSITYALNAFSALLTPAEAEITAGLPGVIQVAENVEFELDTDAGPAWIGAPVVWNGGTPSGLGTKGEGIIIGVLDTGINADHPSFADVGGDGYNHTNPNGAGNYKGVCNPLEASYQPAFPCNDKLIGAWTFVSETYTPEDSDGHGSHTASTAAGNVLNSTLVAPTVSVVAQISGVAPHANIIAYDVCIISCPGAALYNAINQAILDQVDVINYSISGSDSPWTDLIEQAFLNAFNAGIVVAASAGNSGPGARTAAHTSPWVMSTAAVTHNRLVTNGLVNMAGGGAPPENMAGVGLTAAYGPAPIVYAKFYPNPNDPSNPPEQCLQPYPAGTWTNGEIVVCDRGSIARVAKGQNVLAGGAGGMVLANLDANGESINSDLHYLPAVHIGDAAGDILRAWLVASPTAGDPVQLTATIQGYVMDYHAANGDIVASFSSRGPSRYSILAPSVAAPGVDIWAAACDVGAACETNDPEFRLISGTSMASPHIAGAAALVMSARPNLKPAAVISAILSTSYLGDTLLLDDGSTPAGPFDVGSGRVNVAAAVKAGFVLGETGANFAAANPAGGGDPATLNVAALVNNACLGTCSFTRSLTSVSGWPVTWNVRVEPPVNVSVEVQPASFTLNWGETQEVTIKVTMGAVPVDQYLFGTVWFEPAVVRSYLPVLVGLGAGPAGFGEALNGISYDFPPPPAHFPLVVQVPGD